MQTFYGNMPHVHSFRTVNDEVDIVSLRYQPFMFERFLSSGPLRVQHLLPNKQHVCENVNYFYLKLSKVKKNKRYSSIETECFMEIYLSSLFA